jgi:hypothetical protein
MKYLSDVIHGLKLPISHGSVTRYAKLVYLSLLASSALLAHHGIPSVSLAGVDGPGAPLETTSSATLPEGSVLVYMKEDHAEYKTYTDARDGEALRSDYWMYGVGYGVTPWLSAYAFLPFYTKAADDANTMSDFHDINLLGVVGFKYDDGLRLVPSSESLDDMEDWHFTLSFNATLPTGQSDRKDGDGNLIDPGTQTGFGTPSFMAGVSATKWFGNAWTFIADTSYNTFVENKYFDGTKVRFGDEVRLNMATAYNLYGNGAKKLRLDFNMEANFLSLGRDEENGEEVRATGGNILYFTPGFRLFIKQSSVAVGLKLPGWKDLNEASEQQGSEGKERYRMLFTFSTLF